MRLFFAPFSKTEKQDDGTLIVHGIASSEREDSDGEVVKADAVRQAIPDYMRFPAVREMHQPIAAGTALAMNVDDEGLTHLEAHVVDPTSVKKVEAGVLKGFSLGGNVTKRDPKNRKTITGIGLTEVSLVDRPANPDAVLELVKFDGEGRVVKVAERKDQATIGGRIRAAAKEFGIEVAKKWAEPGDLQKGMYAISQLAQLVDSLNWLRQSVESEELYENDEDSELPAQLTAATQQLCEILTAMVGEETAELVGLLGDGENATELRTGGKMATKVQTAEQLEKAKKSFLANFGKLKDHAEKMHKMAGDLKESCDKMHKAAGEHMDHLDKMEAAWEGEEEKPVTEASEDTGKAARAQAITAAAADPTNLEKRFAALDAQLADEKKAREAAEGQVEKLAGAVGDFVKAQTVPARRPALREVAKADDGDALGAKAGDKPKTPLELVKAAQAQPIERAS